MTKINFTYKPSNQSETESENENESENDIKRVKLRGIKMIDLKEPFTDNTQYKNERKLQVNSVYPDLNKDVDLNATTLDDLDHMEENITENIEENMVINNDNIYVDPFKPLFLPTFNKEKVNKISKINSIKNMSISDFLSEIANSYIYILDDLISGNYEDISELLLKENRGIATALLLIIISIFFIFFNNVVES